MRRPYPALLVGLVTLASAAVPAIAVPRVAHAQTEDAREEAKRLFTQGSASFLAKRYPEALESLRLSYKLVPSPNSGLLIARCLREINRPIEAVEMYASVASDARRRAADGDTKYAQTADVATAEGNAVRATLGTVRVRVARPAPGAKIEIDGGVAVPVTDADLVVLHAPGEVLVKLKPSTGAEQSQRATLAAGGELRMEFTPPAVVAEGPPPRPAIAEEGEPPSWTLPASLVAGGVTLVGAGLFVGFGLQSQTIYDELNQRCGAKGCGEAERPRAEEGQRDQSVANVGLAVGIAGAAATVTFLLVRAFAPRSAPAAARALRPGGLRVEL
jgi:hypothetical protein